MMHPFLKITVCAWLATWGQLAHAFTPEVKQVTTNVYAIVGELDQRNPENQGLNNTTGFIITDGGVVLVGSGATSGSAKMLETAIKKVTGKPIKQVINIGVQDHHWMGNGYFLTQKILVTALARTVASQKLSVDEHREYLANTLGGKPADFSADYANNIIDADEKDFTLDGTDFSLRYLGDAHFPGDVVLWLPKEKVVFAGDTVFNDRMLAVLPNHSKLRAWQATFKKMAELKPEHIIPGHGYPSDLATAQKNTGDYLDWLATEVGKSVTNMEDMGDAVKRLSNDHRFDYLKLSTTLHGRNIQQTYQQLETE